MRGGGLSPQTSARQMLHPEFRKSGTGSVMESETFQPRGDAEHFDCVTWTWFEGCGRHRNVGEWVIKGGVGGMGCFVTLSMLVWTGSGGDHMPLPGPHQGTSVLDHTLTGGKQSNHSPRPFKLSRRTPESSPFANRLDHGDLLVTGGLTQ